MEIRLCEHCGAEFSTEMVRKRFCSEECRKKSYNQNGAVIYREQKRLLARQKKNKKDSITDIQRAAQAENMTYGQYVARMEMRR